MKLACTVIFGLFNAVLWSDTVYIVGVDATNQPVYWTFSPPATPSSIQQLDVTAHDGGRANAVTFSPAKTVYIAGQVTEDDFTGAVFWTVPPSGLASGFNEIDAESDIFPVSAQSVAFAPSGIGYIVGKDAVGNAACWTLSPSGTVSGPFEIDVAGFPSSVAFSSSGQGYITGSDGANNAAYWTISNTGTISGPFVLVGGETGGAGFGYAVAVSPTETAYIVGTTTGGEPCYWTISPSGIASSANVIDGGINASARGVAFLPTGAGIFVGQGAGNVSSYWFLTADGTVSLINALPNASGNGSSAYGVAYSSDQTAYIVGGDDGSNAVYWTVPLSGSPIGYNQLIDGALGLCFNIAIDFPLPPTALSGSFVTNDFGLLYENFANLTWTASDSDEVVAYNIYKNGVKIATVDGSTTQYKNNNQNSDSAIYSITTVDVLGNESLPTQVSLN